MNEVEARERGKATGRAMVEAVRRVNGLDAVRLAVVQKRDWTAGIQAAVLADELGVPSELQAAFLDAVRQSAAAVAMDLAALD